MRQHTLSTELPLLIVFIIFTAVFLFFSFLRLRRGKEELSSYKLIFGGPWNEKVEKPICFSATLFLFFKGRL